ncbi:MAG: adaptor protein MecA [Clostridia bacterium]|nr:adaptor protein MecA [Clostridia bacterium]
MLGNPEKDLVKTSKLKFKRKKVNTNSEELVYKFNSFDDFCNFTNLLQNASIKSINLAAKSTILYKYADSYYLALSHINPDYKYNKKLFSLLTEFSTYKNNPELFSRKLCECGEVVIKNNAIKICQKYFI